MCGRHPLMQAQNDWIGSAGMRSCVGPVCAVLFTAGPDEVRSPGSRQSIGIGVLTESRSFPVCGPLFDHHHCHLPLQIRATGFDGRNSIALRHGRRSLGFNAPERSMRCGRSGALEPMAGGPHYWPWRLWRGASAYARLAILPMPQLPTGLCLLCAQPTQRRQRAGGAETGRPFSRCARGSPSHQMSVVSV